MVNILPTTSKNLGSQMMLLCLTKDKEKSVSEDNDKDIVVATMNDYCDDLDED